eukprot:jgi/Chlat1/8173/Chrsp76S07619
MGSATAAPPAAEHAVAAADDADAQAAVELKKKGDAAFRAQNYEAAYEHYAKALAHNPSSTVLLGNRAFAAQKLGRRRQALLDSKRCVELEPEWAKGWYRLGSALLACDWAAEAVEAFKHGLEIAPNNRELKTGHEQALESLQQRQQQLASIKESHSVANGSLENGIAMLSNGSSASSLVDANGSESAVADSQEEQAMAVGSERGSDDGNSLLEADDQEAPAELSQELRSQIWDTLNGTFVSEAPTKHGGPDVPMQSAPKAAPEESSVRPSAVQAEPDTSMPTASFQDSQEEVMQAQRVAEAEAFKTQGNEHYKNGRYHEAMEAYGEAITLMPNEAAYHGNRAAAALMLRRFSEAAAGCIQATTLDPTYTRGYARAGKAYLAMGLVDQARSQYREALRRDPGNRTLAVEAQQAEAVATMLQTGEAALDSNPDRALSLAENALTHAPASERLLMIKCKALLRKERYPDAVAASRDLTWHGDANASEVLVIRGEALYRSGNMPLAQRIFEEALRRDPDSTACRIGLKRVRQLNQLKESGNAAFKNARWQEAFDCYTSALAVDPSLKSDFMATVACNRAAAASKLGNHKQAVEDCDMAIACNPDFVKAFLRRAAAKTALDQFDDAVRDYDKVKQLDPSTPNISQMLKDAQLALKKSKRVDYYKILEIDKTATDADIKKAYRKQALRWHPDKQSANNKETNDTDDQEKADKMFKLIGEANAVLSDPAKRRKFDAGYSLEEIENGGGMDDMFGGFGGGVSMADLFGHGHGHGHGNFAGFRQGPSPFSNGRYSSRHY